jgi:hypothetical protein
MIKILKSGMFRLLENIFYGEVMVLLSYYAPSPKRTIELYFLTNRINIFIFELEIFGLK